MKSNYFFSIAIAAALLINCKGKDGAPGPAGKDGATGPMPTITNQSFLTKEGFMKATLTAMVDGVSTPLNFDFRGNYIGQSAASYRVIDADETKIEIEKVYATDGEVYKNGFVSISFTVDNLTSLNNARSIDFFIFASKQLTPNKVLDIEMRANAGFNGNTTPDDMVITELKYDATSGIISGKFAGMVKGYSSPDQTEKRPITNGSFSATLLQKVIAARKSN